MEPIKIKKLSLSQEFRHLLTAGQGDSISLGELTSDLSFRGHALVCLFLSLPFLLPVPLPGLSTPFGIVIAAAGLAISFAAEPWLPRRLRQRRIPRAKLEEFVVHAEPWLKRLERFLKPRWVRFAVHPVALRFHGTGIFLAAFILALPLPPGGNILPALAIIFFSLALLEEDGAVMVWAYGLLLLNFAVLAGIVYFAQDWLRGMWA